MCDRTIKKPTDAQNLFQLLFPFTPLFILQLGNVPRRRNEFKQISWSWKSAFVHKFLRNFVSNSLTNSEQIKLSLIREREFTVGLQQLHKYLELTFSDHIAALGNPLLMHRLHQLLNLNSGRIEVTSNGFRISLNHLAY